MSLNRLLKVKYTLAFRLTIWYAVIFTVTSFLTFLIFYILTTSVVKKRTDQNLLKELEEFSSLLALKGIDEVKTAVVLESEAEGVEKMFFRVIDTDGRLMDASNMSSWNGIDINRALLKQLNYGSTHIFETQSLPERKYKARILYGMIGPGMILQVGASLKDVTRYLKIFETAFGTIVLALMMLAAMTGWFMAKRALTGVEEVTQTARSISKGDFEQRVPVKTRGYEIEQLAITFNSMLDRIHSLVLEMREMADNIAHDLKSPIARMRGIAEVALTDAKSMDEFEEMAASTIEECDHLLGMINTLLEISEAEAGAGQLKLEWFNISEVIRNACDLFLPIAEDKDISIVTDIPERCKIYGDMQRMQRLVANLLDNALKYTPSKGTVRLSIDCYSDQVVLSFRDTGIGISADDLPHIFDRFYRCDQSRSEPGVGLGLSLGKAIVKAHGGNLVVESSPDKGSTFTVTLPCRLQL